MDLENEPSSKTLRHYHGLPFGSPNSGYAVRYRSPKPLRTLHTRETLSEIALCPNKNRKVKNA